MTVIEEIRNGVPFRNMARNFFLVCCILLLLSTFGLFCFPMRCELIVLCDTSFPLSNRSSDFGSPKLLHLKLVGRTKKKACVHFGPSMTINICQKLKFSSSWYKVSLRVAQVEFAQEKRATTTMNQVGRSCTEIRQTGGGASSRAGCKPIMCNGSKGIKVDKSNCFRNTN